MYQNCGIAFSSNKNRGVWGGHSALLCMVGTAVKYIKVFLELCLPECREGRKAGHSTANRRLIYSFPSESFISYLPALNCSWLWPLKQFCSTKLMSFSRLSLGAVGAWFSAGRAFWRAVFHPKMTSDIFHGELCPDSEGWAKRLVCDADLCCPSAEIQSQQRIARGPQAQNRPLWITSCCIPVTQFIIPVLQEFWVDCKSGNFIEKLNPSTLLLISLSLRTTSSQCIMQSTHSTSRESLLPS